MNVFRILAVFVLAGLGVTACTAPGYQTWQPIGFSQSPKLMMAVSGIESASAFRSSYDLPRVENEMPVNPEASIQRWAKDRIVQSGDGTGTLTYTVTDARVIATALETDESLKAWFTDEQAVRYEINMAARVEVTDPVGATGRAEATVTRSITVPEKATLNDREQALYDMIKAAAIDLDQALEANVRQHLSTWMR